MVQGKDKELFPLVDNMKKSSSRGYNNYVERQATVSNQISQHSNYTFGNGHRHLM
jgi:hypothetical protein